MLDNVPPTFPEENYPVPINELVESLGIDPDVDADDGWGPLDSHDGSPIPGTPKTVNWRTLDDADAKEVWQPLREWVTWLIWRFDLPQNMVPDCWFQHGSLVEELSALFTAFEVAFSDGDQGFGPIGWLERFAIAKPRLRDWYGNECAQHHREYQPRLIIEDAAVWARWSQAAQSRPVENAPN